MPLYKTKVDLWWTQEGDFALDEEREDIASTELDHYRGFTQQVLTRVMSNKGDWALQKLVGASVSDFLGQPNTQATGEAIKLRVEGELIREGLCSPTTLKVDVIPTSKNTVLVLVIVVPPGSRQAITLRFSYDLSENRLVPKNG